MSSGTGTSDIVKDELVRLSNTKSMPSYGPRSLLRMSPVACLIAYAALALYFAISFTVAGDAEDDQVTDTR